MKKILVLGNSIAGVKAIEEIRAFDPHSEIMLWSFDGHIPYDRNLFPALIAKEVNHKTLFYKPKDFYEKHHVQLFLEQKISRINLRRSRITTEDKNQVDYDTLIIADTPELQLPEIKGVNKGGVFSGQRLNEIDQMINILPLTETVVIESDHFWGLQMANAFLKRDKEVVWIVSRPQILPGLCTAEAAEKISGVLQKKGLRILCENAVSEILGETDVKAVRLKSGKVLAASIVIFGKTRADFQLFADPPLTVNQKICVNHQFRTNLDHVFAVDQVCGKADQRFQCSGIRLAGTLEEEGRVVAAAVRGEDKEFHPPLEVHSLVRPDITLDLIGRISTDDDSQNQMIFDEHNLVYRKIFIENQKPVGAFLVNAGNEKDQFIRLIEGTLPSGSLTEFLSQILI